MVSCNVAFACDSGSSSATTRCPSRPRSSASASATSRGSAARRSASSPTTSTARTPRYAAIGQFDVRATPLQMALVTATIANDGQGMRPYLVDEVRAPDLSVLEKTSEEEMPDRAMSSTSASLLTQMMVEVVDQGHRHDRADPRHQGGRQDRHRAERGRPSAVRLVRVLRARPTTPRWRWPSWSQDAGVERDAISGSGLAAPIAKRVMEAVINQ